MKILAKPWTRKELPKRILAIRLQAMGDVIITLPYLQALRNSLPQNTEIDLLTRKEFDAVPRSVELFNRIFSIGGGRSFKRQFVLCLLMLPKILWRRYDVVIDLQSYIHQQAGEKICCAESVERI
jgi:ADP-heptose:LPS heptosyltransferase